MLIDNIRPEVMQLDGESTGEHTEEYMNYFSLCPWLGWRFLGDGGDDSMVFWFGFGGEFWVFYNG